MQDSVNLVEGLTQKNAEMVESASSAVTAVDGQIEALARVIAASDEQTESPAGIKRRPAA